MNVLIITTSFPPDTAISAVRPFMFAKYLQTAGHQVTVLRSGEIMNKADNSYDYTNTGIRVYSYMGKNSHAERYMRGEPLTEKPYGKRKMSNIPSYIRSPLVWCYRRVSFFASFLDMNRRLKQQKAWIDANTKEHFDVVFATYSNLENILAGKYAAETFSCKWIADFRDPIAQRTRDYLWEYPIRKAIQKKATQSADACTAASVELSEILMEGSDRRVITLYNGFDTPAIVPKSAPSDGMLRFCYTGVLYNNQSISPLFVAIRQLCDLGKMDLSRVYFEYAGPHFELIYEQAKTYGIEEILIDHDFVSRAEAYEIQCRSDIFVVLSWNTNLERGILTGKFYEGIRAKKPILSIVAGARPDSELTLLNRKYHYGYCYETCREKTQFEALKEWIAEAYSCKQKGTPIPHSPTPELSTDFCYENLTKKLAYIMEDTLRET